MVAVQKAAPKLGNEIDEKGMNHITILVKIVRWAKFLMQIDRSYKKVT